jgi:WD40 repeat protein
LEFAFDAFVSAAAFDGGEAVFALGDGRVVWEGGASVLAHDGAVLAASRHPSGEGILTGGDDGRLVWARRTGGEALAERGGAWIDVVAASPASGLIAFGCGRDVWIKDCADAAFERRFTHQRSVAAVAFDPKGRRLAAATYGGAALWWAKIAEQKPVMLRWAGSHIAVAFSPDGRFLVSSMQENAVHGWRLKDSADMRMGGYPSKITSLVFVDGWLATSGANGVVMWPFSGADGPMGKQALEIGVDETTLIARVAGDGAWMAAGLQDGRVWVSGADGGGLHYVKPEPGAPITALAVQDGRIAWGDEAGAAGVAGAQT